MAGYILERINFTRTQSAQLDISREALVGAIQNGQLRAFPLTPAQIEAAYRDFRFDTDANAGPIVSEMIRTTCRRLRSDETAIGITCATYERRGLALRNKVVTTVLDFMRSRAANSYNGNESYSKTVSGFDAAYAWFERQVGAA